MSLELGCVYSVSAPLRGSSDLRLTLMYLFLEGAVILVHADLMSYKPTTLNFYLKDAIQPHVEIVCSATNLL